MGRSYVLGKIVTPVLAVMLSSTAAFAGQIPIALTGYNQQIVVGSGTAVTASASGGPNISGAGTFYQAGFDTATPSSGLTSGVFTSMADPSTQGLLQSFTGNDVAMVNATTPSVKLTLASPAAYSSLSFFVASAVGSGTLDYQLNYVGSAPTTGSLTIADWYSATGAAIIAGGYALTPNGPAIETPGNVEILQENLTGPLNSVQSLSSIQLTWDSSNTALNNISVFGVSGTPVPEPASLALISMGLVTLGLARRRARS